MGVSTPKTPFNLAEFLSQKAPPGSRRKPAWNRPRAAAPTTDDSGVTKAKDSRPASKEE